MHSLLLQSGNGPDSALYQIGVHAHRCIHLTHRDVDLINAQALLPGGGTDLTHKCRYPLHGLHDIIDNLTGLVDPLRPGFYVLDGALYQRLDFLCGLGTALSQRAHLPGHNSKATSMLTSTGRLHGGVKSQNIGLESDAVNYVDNLTNLS